MKWMDDDGETYNDKNFDYYFLENYVKSNQKLKSKEEIDTEALDNIDIKFIESYLRKKKLEILNKK